MLQRGYSCLTDVHVMLSLDLARYSLLVARLEKHQLAQSRQQRQQQQEQQQKAEMAEKMAAGAKTLSETNVGQGNALEAMTQGGAR